MNVSAHTLNPDSEMSTEAINSVVHVAGKGIKPPSTVPWSFATAAIRGRPYRDEISPLEQGPQG